VIFIAINKTSYSILWGMDLKYKTMKNTKTKIKKGMFIGAVSMLLLTVIALGVNQLLNYAGVKGVEAGQFINDPVPYKPVQEINVISIPNEKITNENTGGHRYLTLKEREWVLDTCERSGLKREDVACLIQNESSWDENGWLTNWDNRAGTDRGLFAFNSIHHGEVSNRCAFNFVCSTYEFIRVTKANGNYNAWTGYVKNCK
jgi:hypothetical protein